MSDRKWVVNASPVILLGKIEHLGLLEALCADMVIPTAVATEACTEPHRDAGQDWLRNQAQAHVHDVGPIDPLITTWDLGIGESKVLTWARQHPGFEAILDDLAPSEHEALEALQFFLGTFRGRFYCEVKFHQFILNPTSKLSCRPDARQF